MISPYVARLREQLGTSRLLLPSVTAIIYGANNEILLVHQRDGNVWSTPGGSIEPDESPVDAVVRETWEETGLVVQPIGLLGVFECSVVGGQRRNSTDETVECRFVSEIEFNNLKVSEWSREVLPLCYARPAEPIIDNVSWVPPLVPVRKT
jgi:8-oxo-dGTP pyrophosphatase MutT (NUDIX family)